MVSGDPVSVYLVQPGSQWQLVCSRPRMSVQTVLGAFPKCILILDEHL